MSEVRVDRGERGFTDILEAARAGDTRAKAMLIRRYEARVLRRVRRQLTPLLRRHYDSLDVGQSVFADLLTSLDTFEDRGEDAFSNWLYVVIRNKVNAKLRRLLHPNGGRREESTDRPIEIHAPQAEPVDLLTVAEREARVQKVVAELTESQRQLLNWRLNDGLTFAQIAARLELSSEDAARKRFQRCLAAVRRLDNATRMP